HLCPKLITEKDFQPRRRRRAGQGGPCRPEKRPRGTPSQSHRELRLWRLARDLFAQQEAGFGSHAVLANAPSSLPTREIGDTLGGDLAKPPATRCMRLLRTRR